MFLRTFFAFMTCTLISCGGSQQPVIDNPGQAIFSQLLPPFSIQVGEIIVLQVKATSPNGDELSYTWTAKNTKGDDVTDTVFVDEKANLDGEAEGEDAEKEAVDNQSPLVRFTTNEAGTYLVTVTIDNGSGTQITESTIIEVASVNRPPVLDATDAITISPGPPHRVAQAVFLTAHAADADGERLTYEWTAKDQNNQAVQNVLEEGTGPSIKFTTDTPGSYLVSVVVKDGNGGQDRAAAVIVIQP